MDANLTVKGNTEIRVYHGKEFPTGERYSFLWFGHPGEAPVINVDLDESDKLLKILKKGPWTCCLK